jgi:hypothetical protein
LLPDILKLGAAARNEDMRVSRTLEILREKLPFDQDTYTNRKPFRVSEMAAHPLINAATYISRKNKPHFPLLSFINVHSGNYQDEALWANADQTYALLQELKLLRKTCRYEHSIHNFDAGAFYKTWRNEDSDQEFQLWLDEIEQALAIAIENNHWIRLSL